MSEQELHLLARQAETAATPLEREIVRAHFRTLGVHQSYWPEHLMNFDTKD